MNVERKSGPPRLGEAGIPTETIEKIPDTLGLDVSQTKMFRRVTQEYLDAQALLASTHELYKLRIEDARNPLARLEGQVTMAEFEVLEAEMETARRSGDDHNPEKLDVNLGRLGVKLFRFGHRLSFLRRIFTPIVFHIIGGQETPQHPSVLLAEANLTRVQELLPQARADFREKQAVIDEEIQPQISQNQKEVERLESVLVGFAVRMATASRDKVLLLARLIPDKQENIINIYVLAVATSEEELIYFPEFLLDTPEFQWESKLPRHKKLWHGRNQEWVEIKRNPETDRDEVIVRPLTKEEFDQLPDRVKNLWRGFLRKRFLEDLRS